MRIDLLQTIIDLLRGKSLFIKEFLDIYNGINQSKEIKTLILGSSHMKQGYIPNNDYGEFSLATTSQDLYYSYQLYRFCCDHNIQISNVVISCSVFSAGAMLVKTKNARLCILLKELFGIEYQDKNSAKQKYLFILEPIFKFYIKMFDFAKIRVKNSNLLPLRFNEEQIKVLAKKHYKNHTRIVSQLCYLEKLLSETKEKNQNVFIVIPPVTDFYKNALPDGKEIFEYVFNYSQQYPHVNVIDLYNSDKFNLSDFKDGDHLNSQGAKKLTNIVRDMIVS